MLGKSSRVARTVALITVGMLGLTACAGVSGNAGVGSNRGPLKSEDLLVDTPDPSGEIASVNWNLPFGEPSSLDPIKAFNYPENTVVANLCEPLLQVKPDFSIEPNLASSFEAKSPQEYVYQIRDDVTFWDGSDMTMEDVIWSLERHRNPEESSYWAGAVTDNIQSIEQTGDWELTIKLKNPDMTFNSYMVTPIGAVVQKKHREKQGENYGTPTGQVMCTGPFSVEAWQQGQTLTLQRNDAYWNQDLLPKVQTMKFRFTVDEASISSSMRTGELDGSYDVPLGSLPSLSTAESGELYYGVSTQIVAVIATGSGSLGDPAVRRALSLATDKQAIADAVFHGTAAPSASLIPNGGWTYGSEIFEQGRVGLPKPEVNLDLAKEELKEANVDLSATVRIAYPAERMFYADILSEMSNAAAKLGFTLEPVGIPSSQFGAMFSDEAARSQYDGFVTYNYMDVADPLSHLRNIMQTAGGSNYNNYSDAKTDELILKALAEPDDERRAELTNELQQIAMHEMPWIPLVDPATRLYMSDEITGVPASFSYIYYPWAVEVGVKE